jgi:hypothetical protein
MHIDLREGVLAVTTEPVLLDGVQLGAFDINLEWGRMAARSCYRVVAINPRPAATDSAVVHPHVRAEQLCEGEASSVIRAALASGRLVDFFLIVARTLATYNASSAYVILDAWDGVSCDDCGATVDKDQLACCEHCESDLCLDCAARCSECSVNMCCDCSVKCRACRDTCCPACMVTCSVCHQDFCKGCLDDDSQPCATCVQATEVDEAAVWKAESGAATTTAAKPEDLALCLGETAVSPGCRPH